MVMAVLSCGDVYYAVKRGSFFDATQIKAIEPYFPVVQSVVRYLENRNLDFFQISNLVTFHNYYCSDSFLSFLAGCFSGARPENRT